MCLHHRPPLQVAHCINLVFAVAALSSVASKRVGGSALALRQLSHRLGAAEANALHTALCARLSAAASEQHVLWLAAEELRARFPAATAQALASLAEEGDTLATVAALRVDAATEAQRVALHAALPRAVALRSRDAATDDERMEDEEEDDDAYGAECAGHNTSVLLVVRQAPLQGCFVADSADWPRGVATFGDWAAAAAGCADVPVGQCVTAALVCSAGARAVGFVTLLFHRPGDFAAAHPELRLFADAVGGALHARRALDAAEATARALAAVAASATEDAFAANSLSEMEARIQRRGLLLGRTSVPSRSSCDSSVAPPPSSEPSAGVTAGGAADEVEHTQPERHAAATVVCASVDGLDELAAARGPEAALALLDALWQRFDTRELVRATECSCGLNAPSLMTYVLVAAHAVAQAVCGCATAVCGAALLCSRAAAPAGATPCMQRRWACARC